MDSPGSSVGASAPAAFVLLLRELLERGRPVVVRGKDTLELRQRTVTVEHPERRVYVVPGRTNSVVGTVAETIWVLAGRDDLEFLTPYVPRAIEFSDDGRTWRAAYGPRLRSWNGVDQLAETVKTLRVDPASRQAVAVIFDPDRDYVASKDIPCANWLHFLLRDGRLYLSVAIRSNDIIWGFSGVNSFEWSVVQAVVANSLGVHYLGHLTSFAGSVHLYDYHFVQAKNIVARDGGRDIYTLGVRPTHVGLNLENLDRRLEEFFAAELMIRAGDWEAAVQRRTGDDLLDSGLALIAAFHVGTSDPQSPAIETCLRAVPGEDLRIAGLEFCARTFHRPDLLSNLPPAVAALYTEHSAVGTPNPVNDLLLGIERLHAEKSAAYGDSWKRRGEQIGILANIARKVDRLDHVIQTNLVPKDETAADTVIDLLVYSVKYLTFLADMEAAAAHRIYGGEIGLRPPFSDGTEGFSRLLYRVCVSSINPAPVRTALTTARDVFSRIEHAFADGVPPISQRVDLALELSHAAWQLVVSLSASPLPPPTTRPDTPGA